MLSVQAVGLLMWNKYNSSNFRKLFQYFNVKAIVSFVKIPMTVSFNILTSYLSFSKTSEFILLALNPIHL